jgi:hypothetical protein
MANTLSRILPFRQYNENDVVNFYSLNEVTGAAGSLVKVSNANLDQDPVNYVTRGDAYGYLNALAHSTSLYPEVPYKVSKVVSTGDFFSGAPLGIMLRDVRAVDENGENLLYYPQKREELQCVLSGEAVPVLTKGVLTFTQTAFTNAGLGGAHRPAVGDWIVPSVDGAFTGIRTADKQAYTNYKVGVVLATGTRESAQDVDAFTGYYAMVKIDL